MNIELYHSDYLNFVEFNSTGDNENFLRCDPESKYLDTEIFNLFQPHFENASKIFDYFTGTKYNSRTIIVLRNELVSSQQAWKQIASSVDFSNHISKLFMGRDFLTLLQNTDPTWEDHWMEYRDKLLHVLGELIQLTEKCAYEERILWVIGY